MSSVRLATALGVVAVVASTALAGWLGFREYQALRAQQQCELLVQVGRQGAVNLTTIDWQHADADIQRILDSATGTFYDEFSKRHNLSLDVVKKAQSKSSGNGHGSGPGVANRATKPRCWSPYLSEPQLSVRPKRSHGIGECESR